MCDSDDIYPESSDPPTSGSQQPSCAICLDQFKSGEDTCSAQNINCPHEYHLQCIFPWLLQSQDCPCCRRDFLSIDTEAVEPHHTRTAITLETNTMDFLYSI
jgi:Ring finger domain